MFDLKVKFIALINTFAAEIFKSIFKIIFLQNIVKSAFEGGSMLRNYVLQHDIGVECDFLQAIAILTFEGVCVRLKLLRPRPPNIC